jgi:GMP synthase (glutamine-hydrolysing)
LKHEAILVLDFGGQYNQLIARRVREHNVFCEVLPYNVSIDRIREGGYKGIIFTGGPSSVSAAESPRCDRQVFELGIPVLGICYGAQLMSVMLGGEVQRPEKREYGKTDVYVSALRLHAFPRCLSKRNYLLDESYRSYPDMPEGFVRPPGSKLAPSPVWNTRQIIIMLSSSILK